MKNKSQEHCASFMLCVVVALWNECRQIALYVSFINVVFRGMADESGRRVWRIAAEGRLQHRPRST